MAVGFGFEATPDAHAFFDGAQFFDGDWASYGAYDGDDLVGVARMLAVAETDAVALFGAATLPEGRNRGAQGALLDVRIREARDRGLALRLGRDLAGERGEPQPLAAQHAAGRPDRGAHPAELGVAQPRGELSLRPP